MNTYLENKLADLEEKEAFHDNCGRHCQTCGELAKQIKETRKALAEVEEDDFTHANDDPYYGVQ